MADPGARADGTYQATIRVTVNGQTTAVSVELNVGTSKKLTLTGHGGPKVTPSSLSFGSIVQGSSNPLPLHILVTNNDDTASLAWKMTNMAGGSFSGAAWLSLASTSGTVPALSQQRIRVNAVNIASLPKGNYSATLTFNLQAGSFNINPHVTVSLTIQ